MSTELTMPAFSPSMTEATLVKWYVTEGDSVEKGDIVADIETDKATLELEASESGTITKILVAPSTESVPVNTPLAILSLKGSANSPVISSAISNETSKEDRDAKNDESHTASAVSATPIARRLAEKSGISIAEIEGSGSRGRVVRSDVERVRDEPAEFEIIKLDAMRRTIARRLTESKQTVPHFYLSADVELDSMLALRAELNAMYALNSEEPAYKVSVNDMVVKALAKALSEVPDANVSWSDESIIKYKSVDVSVAVAVDGGLVTPVVKNADAKPLLEISSEIKDLAARARARELSPHEYQGGTTTVSNLGMFGVDSFDAIINPPQGTILAVGAGLEQPVVREGKIEVAKVMRVTLSVDHRMIDGAVAANLLSAFKNNIESPLFLLL